MANSPLLKLYQGSEYIGSLKHIEHAAILAGALGKTQVRKGHTKRNILWDEGSEAFSAAMSFDDAAAIMRERI